MATNESYNLPLNELWTLKIYKIENQEQHHTSFTKYYSRTRDQGPQTKKLKNAR